MPEYYNSENRNGSRRGNSRQPSHSSGRPAYEDSRYPAFEEGYTSADNRSRQGYQQSARPAARQNDSGYSDRFINAGDRYMRGFDDASDVRGNDRSADRSLGRYAGQEESFGQSQNAGRGYAQNEEYYDRRQISGQRAGGGYYAQDAQASYDQRYGRGYAQQEPAYSQRYQSGYAQQEQDYGQRYQTGYAQQEQDYGQRYQSGYAHQEPAYSQRYQADYEQDIDDGFDDDLAEDNRAVMTERSRTKSAESYYRPANVKKAGINPGQIIDSALNWLNNLTSRQMTIMLAVVTVVIIAVILTVCLALSSDSCGSCGSSDIPVIEQGDGEEALNDGQNFYYEDQETGATEVVSTSDGMITIDEEFETESFTVSVTGADGSYVRTDVSREEAATLTISGQNQTGFDFTLEIKTGETAVSLSGYAYFCDEKEAAYEGGQGMISFTFGDGGIAVYQVDIIEAFGSVLPDGLYVAGKPAYIEDAAAQTELDANIRSSEAVQSALAAMLTENDMMLFNSIFQNGTERVYEGSEKGYDKNGTAINIDAQFDAVKYYAYIDGTGEELVLICTNDGMVYLGICDGMEYRYYTNDPSFAETAPKAIYGQAMGRNMELSYQQ